MNFINRLIGSGSYSSVALEEKPMTQSEKDKQLVEAVTDAEIEEVKEAIALGANVNCSFKSTDILGERPLHLAVKMKQAGIVKVLIEAKASVTLRNNMSETPCGLAYALGDEDIQSLLKVVLQRI